MEKITIEKAILEHNKNDLILLDVRSQTEFNQNHIPGSFNVPIDSFEEYKKELENLKENVVLVCRSGIRATRACQYLTKITDSKIKILDGGIMAWEEKGGIIKKKRGVWDLERQVRFSAGLIVLIGSILSFINYSFIIIPLFVAIGLILASITNSCLMGKILLKLPFNKIEDKTKITSNIKGVSFSN